VKRERETPISACLCSFALAGWLYICMYVCIYVHLYVLCRMYVLRTIQQSPRMIRANHGRKTRRPRHADSLLPSSGRNLSRGYICQYIYGKDRYTLIQSISYPNEKRERERERKVSHYQLSHQTPTHVLYNQPGLHAWLSMASVPSMPSTQHCAVRPPPQSAV